MVEDHELGLSKREACVGPTLVVTELDLKGIIIQEFDDGPDLSANQLTLR